MARYTWQAKILHPIFGCSYMYLLKSALIKFSREKVLRWAEQQVKGQMVKSESEYWKYVYRTSIPYLTRVCMCFSKDGMTPGYSVPSSLFGWRLTRRITGELLSAWNSDLFMHVFTRVLSSQRRKPLICGHSASSSACHEQTGCI